MPKIDSVHKDSEQTARDQELRPRHPDPYL